MDIPVDLFFVDFLPDSRDPWLNQITMKQTHQFQGECFLGHFFLLHLSHVPWSSHLLIGILIMGIFSPLLLGWWVYPLLYGNNGSWSTLAHMQIQDFARWKHFSTSCFLGLSRVLSPKCCSPQTYLTPGDLEATKKSILLVACCTKKCCRNAPRLFFVERDIFGEVKETKESI